MRFGSVCSGVEAASVAFAPFGWEPAWLAEVDVSAAAVLAHRLGASAPVFPLPGSERRLKQIAWGESVTNWGDMTKLPDLVREGRADAPDILCGGTPCQSYSLAGRRKGLGDERGQLTLKFVELADEIDNKRAERGEQPCVILWENVPGVLTDNTNAFGNFLADLCGDNEPLEPGPRPEPGRSSAHWSWKKKTSEHVPKWPYSGVAVGPRRTVAWRTPDAQYFGLAQRRARVLVVASACEGFDPETVLLEFDGLRRDSAPSRAEGEAVAGTLDSRSTAGGFPGTDGACANRVIPCPADLAYSGLVPQWWDGSPVSQTLDAVLHKRQQMPEKNRFPAVLQPVIPGTPYPEKEVCGTLSDGAHYGGGTNGQDAYTGRIFAVLQPVTEPEPITFNWMAGGKQGNLGFDPATRTAGALQAHQHPAVVQHLPEAFAFDVKNGLAPHGSFRAERTAFPLKSSDSKDPQLVGHHNLRVMPFNTTQITNPSNGANPKWGDPCHTLAAGNHPPAVCVTGDITHTLTAEGFDASEDGTGRGNPITVSYGVEMAVRRLMPIEAERLQGFPDEWTLVPVGNKPAADGPRYKQMGNSWPVSMIRWVGRRIDAELNQPSSITLPPEEYRWLTAP